MKTGIIILAAGNSSRLGRPKQLLEYRGSTLLEIACQAAIHTGYNPVIIVLGSHAAEIIKVCQLPDDTYIINTNWEEGMSSSIAAGLSAMLRQHPSLENVIIAPSDQVFVHADLFRQLVMQKEKTHKNIIASVYNKTTGIPVLFNKIYFEELLQLKGQRGAKKIIAQYPEDLETVPFDLGHIDIDTETDYYNLINQQ